MIWAVGIFLYLAVGVLFAVAIAAACDDLDRDDLNDLYLLGCLVFFWPLVILIMVPTGLGFLIGKIGERISKAKGGAE